MLVISRKSNQTLLVGKEIEIRVLGARNDSVKLGIVAPQKIPVIRGELIERVTEQNKAALLLDPGLLKQHAQKSTKRYEVKIPSNPSGKHLGSWLTHEIRNYLTPIHGELQLALLDCEEGDLKQGLTEAEAQSRKLGTWLQKISQLGRSSTLRTDPCELDLLLGLELERWSGEAELSIDCEEGINILTSSPGLASPLLELLKNAEEACADSISIKATQSERYVRIEVEDNGGGIDRASLENLKRPYFSTKNHHLGKGLALVRNFIDGFGGELVVESALGAGTKVTIQLARSQPRAPQTESRVILLGSYDGPERKALESHGYQVLLAETEQQAALLRERYPRLKFLNARQISIKLWLDEQTN